MVVAESLKEIVRQLFRAFGINVSRTQCKSGNTFWKFSRTLKREDGYWRLHPMPDSAQLEEYYSTSYWSSFRGTATPPLLSMRDIEHYEVLTCGNWMPIGGQFVNFGAGHGGVSFLALARDMQVINVDPFAAPHLEAAGATLVSELPRDGRADLIYASHSLEHVSDVDSVMANFATSLKKNGIIFLEVPDLSKCWPESEPSFEEPHTYYFSRYFFETVGHGLIPLLIQHRKRTGAAGQQYSIPADALESDVLQVVLSKP